MRTIRIVFVLMAAVFVSGFYCTKIEYTNPLDNKGSLYAGDSATRDDDNDGTVNYYDPDWPPNVVLKKSYPKIIFVGPDTVIIAKDDPQHILDGISQTATDSIWGNLTDSIRLTGTVFRSVCSTFTVTYSVTNPVGYESRRSRTIIVDCAPPDIVLKGDNPLRLVLGTNYVEPGADATDNIDGILTSRITITGTVDKNTEGIDTVTYTVSDKAGNIGSQKRVVIVEKVEVQDTIPPVLTLVGNNPLSIQQNAVFTDPGVTAVDNIDGPISSTQVTRTIATAAGVAANFSTFASITGTYIITYSVADAAMNRDIITRTVVVHGIITGKDTTPPVITFTKCSICTTKVGQAWVEPGYTAFDDHDGDVKSKVILESPTPNTAIPGSYMLKYSVTDSAGNKGTYVRTVTVVGINTDTTKPTIRLEGAVQCTVLVGKSFTEPGYTAQDNVDLIITDKVTRTVKNSAGTVKEFNAFYTAIDKYTITYTVSDAAGNAAVPAIRNVVVKDTVIDTTGGGLLAKYGLPLAAALSKVEKTYSGGVTADGTGAPDVSYITAFQLSWDDAQKKVYQFRLNTKTGVPGYSVDLTGTVDANNTFGQAKPGFTLSTSGFTGLDGDYYIKADATQCVWVRKDGKFAVIFK